MAKNITDFLEILFEYHFLNIIMNVNSFSDLKFERYCEYYPGILLQVSLKQETKIDQTMKYFLKNYWAMKYLGLWSPGLRFFFLKNCKTLRS